MRNDPVQASQVGFCIEAEIMRMPPQVKSGFGLGRSRHRPFYHRQMVGMQRCQAPGAGSQEMAGRHVVAPRPEKMRPKHTCMGIDQSHQTAGQRLPGTGYRPIGPRTGIAPIASDTPLFNRVEMQW